MSQPRELHWHPTQDEWTYFISGQARVTIFAANGNARTFNYQAGDVGYVPVANGHYVEHIGNETLHFLETPMLMYAFAVIKLHLRPHQNILELSG
ncbi:RmlC-like cupin domain-containing protein [Hysterangium stoloniferum]|nr:RmlC-like cupin domain-containing protein [Hysterangium stoloniferum]